MDLTIPVKDSILNIRVAILAKTINGYLLEKNPGGFLYFIGGRIKINETSEEAAKREIYEEIGIHVEKFNFKTVVENFFISENQPIHEICFVYMVDKELEIDSKKLKLVECSITDFKNTDIKPVAIRDFILNNDNRPNIVNKDY